MRFTGEPLLLYRLAGEMTIHRHAEDLLYRTVSIKDKQRFWKRMLIVDDDEDVTITFKSGIEDSNNNLDPIKRIEVYTSNDPVVALSEFRPNFYDLILVDINVPHMNGFELCEKIFAIDINVRVCFMSSGEINREALRETNKAGRLLYQKTSRYRLFA